MLQTHTTSTSAILGYSYFDKTGFDVYLTEGTLNSNGKRIELDYKEIYPFGYAFNNLPGVKYVIHIEYQYDTKDGTGVHKMHYAIPFALENWNFDSNIVAESPNYHAINVKNLDFDDDERFVLIPTDLKNKTFLYYYNQYKSTEEEYAYNYLYTNEEYKVYSIHYEKSLNVYKKIDGEERIFTTNDCVTTDGNLEILSQNYQTIRTKDGIKPEYFIIEVPRKKSGSDYTSLDHLEFKYNMLRLKIGNYKNQVDIGELELDIDIINMEFMNDPDRAHRSYRLSFEFDFELGYYICTKIDNVDVSFFYEYSSYAPMEHYYYLMRYYFQNEEVRYNIQYYYNEHLFSNLTDDKGRLNITPGSNKSYVSYYTYSV